MQGVGLPFSSSRRETVCPSSTFSGSHHRCLTSRGGGGGSSSTPGVRGVVERGGFGPHKFPRIDGSLSCIAETRVSCHGSFSLDSFRQYDCGVIHQPSGQDSFPIPVSAGLGPVGMVSLKENFPSGSSHSGRREHCGGYPLQGKVSPFRMGSESLSVSEDLSCVVSLPPPPPPPPPPR